MSVGQEDPDAVRSLRQSTLSLRQRSLDEADVTHHPQLRHAPETVSEIRRSHESRNADRGAGPVEPSTGGRARRKGHEVMTDGHGRGLEARVHLELGQDALNMGSDGIAADAQPARDRAAVGSPHEKAEALPLARGELSDEQGDAVGGATTMAC